MFWTKENEIFLPNWSVHSSRAKPQMVKEKKVYLRKNADLNLNEPLIHQ